MLLDRIKKTLVPQRPADAGPKPGLRHYERQVGDRPARYHLRVDADGSGLLIANAAAACRLSPSGVVIAEGLLEQQDEKAIARRLGQAFAGTDAETVKADVKRVRETLDDMAYPGGRYPLFNLDDPEATAHGRALSAPLSAEMGIDGTGDPKARIDKLWEVAVPQVVLVHLPGAPADVLVEAVERAEDHGLIAGVRAPGSALLEGDLLGRLVEAGLDHVDVYWAGDDAAFHDGLFGEGDHAAAKTVFARCKELELCPIAVVPLVAGSLERIEAGLSALPGMDVGAATLFALAQAEGAEATGGLLAGALRQASATAEALGDRLQINLVFAPPVERNPGEPLAEQVRRGPRAAGEAAVRITPDGSVIPPHGPRKPVGNLLTQPFAEIWSHAAFRHLREAVAAPERCDACPGLNACMAGCPVDLAVWARLETAEPPAEEGGAR
jgi:radical SAM protein with 4Fe4S-binding SPASM domain